jgi:hypothetical protein
MIADGICRSCGAEVVWVKGERHSMICNPKVFTVITDQGIVIQGRESHFSTCPQAAEWRKKKIRGEVNKEDDRR